MLLCGPSAPEMVKTTGLKSPCSTKRTHKLPRFLNYYRTSNSYCLSLSLSLSPLSLLFSLFRSHVSGRVLGSLTRLRTHTFKLGRAFGADQRCAKLFAVMYR